jgi:phosphatidylethanolamine-binding protein (PEBP) family uncharacterized protein
MMGSTQRSDRRVGVMAVAFVLAVLAVVGCGGSSGQGTSSRKLHGSSIPANPLSATEPPARTSTSSEPSPTVSIDVTIPVLLKTPLLGIPERYTCDGADVSIPVWWSRLPRGVAELALFVIGLRPIHGEFYFAWAVAGLDPTSHGISPGRLPPGAVVGRNSLGGVGYSICPPKGRRETYFVKILALSHPLNASPGFDAPTLYRRAAAEATAVGFAAGAYKGQ